MKKDAQAWRGAVQAAAQKGKPKRAQEAHPALGARVPASLLEDLRDLARLQTRARGERVLIADLVEEALRDLLEKHKFKSK